MVSCQFEEGVHLLVWDLFELIRGVGYFKGFIRHWVESALECEFEVLELRLRHDPCLQNELIPVDRLKLLFLASPANTAILEGRLQSLLDC